MVKAYRIPRKPAEIAFGRKVSGEAFTEQRFSFETQMPSGFGKNDHIRGMIYMPAHPRGNDVFLVLPGSHEDTSAEWIAQTFASLGYKAVRIRSGFAPMPKQVFRKAALGKTAVETIAFAAGFFNISMRTHTIDLMRLEDSLAAGARTQPRFHAVGISLGGISAALLAGIDPRIRSLLMIVSSGSVARILMDTTNPEISDVRKTLMEKFGLGYGEAYALLERGLAPGEPLTYAGRLDASRVLMVSGALDMMGIPVDSAIPGRATRETWQAFGQPEWIVLPTGHASSFLAFSPGWIELPYVWHWTKTMFEPYTTHIIRDHYLPKALAN